MGKLTEVRPMTGFLATLTESQKEAALAYRGAENHGDLRFATPAGRAALTKARGK